MNLKDFFSLRGRMRRKHYVITYVVALILVLAIFAIWKASHIEAVAYLRLLLMAAFIPPTVRRIHDVGHSGWLVIGVLLVPLVSPLLLLLPGVPGSNAYGPDPKAVAV
jgi:uncharacterized membrane protein YhaH (DUF805 family)